MGFSLSHAHQVVRPVREIEAELLDAEVNRAKTGRKTVTDTEHGAGDGITPLLPWNAGPGVVDASIRSLGSS